MLYCQNNSGSDGNASGRTCCWFLKESGEVGGIVIGWPMQSGKSVLPICHVLCGSLKVHRFRWDGLDNVGTLSGSYVRRVQLTVQVVRIFLEGEPTSRENTHHFIAPFFVSVPNGLIDRILQSTYLGFLRVELTRVPLFEILLGHKRANTGGRSRPPTTLAISNLPTGHD
jgi:hypothetical protein